MKGKKEWFLTKTARGTLEKKGGKSRKTQLVFMKGNMCPRDGKTKYF